MSVADEAVATALCFEAQKMAYRQTKEGIAVTLVINPVDVPGALATARLGTRYQIAMVEIGDDEKPVASPTAGRSKLSVVGKQQYENASEMERARTRAALLARDAEFIAWANKSSDFINVHDEQTAKQFIHEWCGVQSRSEIAADRNAYLAYLRLEAKFEEAVGRRPEKRA